MNTIEWRWEMHDVNYAGDNAYFVESNIYKSKLPQQK